MAKNITDITPDELRCGPIASSCPAVYDAKCPAGDCPSVHSHGDDLIIVGKAITEQNYPELAGRIGPDERAVKISADLVMAALRERRD